MQSLTNQRADISIITLAIILMCNISGMYVKIACVHPPSPLKILRKGIFLRGEGGCTQANVKKAPNKLHTNYLKHSVTKIFSQTLHEKHYY